MAATIRVPTVFTASDKFTGVLKTMVGGVKSFAKSSISAVDRVNTRLNKMYSGLNNYVQIGLGVGVGGLLLAAGSSLMQYEDQVAQFRTIVSDLSDKDFAKYEQAIGSVAKTTKKSTIEVAASFEKIAGLNETFAKTSEGLSQVATAAITLSKASKDELGASAENLVGIMNQFDFAADQADRVINVLAAGQAVGAASITQSAEAYKNFGTVAKGANITLEQSQALIQTVAKKSIFGAEAGTKLRGATLQLQKAGLGYKSGMFNINDALDEANKKTAKLSTAKLRDAYLTKTFGAENLTVGKILLENVKVYKGFIDSVTGTSEASKAAAINSATLSVKWQELKNSAINYVTTNDQANKGMQISKNLLGFVADNIGTIISVSVGLLVFLGTIKAITTAVAIGQGVIAAYTAVTATYSAIAVTAALTGASFAAVIWATVWPVLAVIAAVVAIILIIKNWGAISDWFSEKWNQLTSFLSESWTRITDLFSNFDFKGLFMSIGQSIIDFMLFPLKSVLSLISLLPGKLGALAKSGLDKINIMSNIESNNKNDVLPSTSQASSEKIEKSVTENKLSIDIKDKGNNVEKTEQTKGNRSVPIKLTPTLGF